MTMRRRPRHISALAAAAFALTLLVIGKDREDGWIRGRILIDEVPIETNEFKDLKFLFFGTSRTYGTLLEDRNHQAFPFLIHPNAVNLAVPSSTPTYPCKCIESMIEQHTNNNNRNDDGGGGDGGGGDGGGDDDSFDVIVLEYDREFSDEILWIVHRLRQRYPKAHIIVLELWLLSFYVHLPTSHFMHIWTNQKGGFENCGKMGDPKLPQYVVDHSKSEDWALHKDSFLFSEDERKQLAEDDAVIVSVKIPENGHTAIKEFQNLFFNDMNHYTVEGHKRIRDLILEELRQSKVRTHHETFLNPWEFSDSCESWFRSGQTNLGHDKDFLMNQFKPGKFALETKNPYSWIEVQNDMKEEADLYIERMVTGPNCLYPNMKVSIAGSSQPSVTATCDKLPWPWEVNVARALYIGRIPPGKSVVEFRRDPKDDNAPWPFRLLGLAVTSPQNSIKKTWETKEQFK